MLDLNSTSPWRSAWLALQQLEKSVDLKSKVTVREQYKAFRRSLADGIGKLLDFIDLLIAVQSLRLKVETWKKIDKELKACSLHQETDNNMDKRSCCQSLFDFEEELRIRIEGMKATHNKTRAACQQIENNLQALLAMRSYSSVCFSRLTGYDITHFPLTRVHSLFIIGTAVLLLGLTGLSSTLSKILFVARIPLGVIFLLCLAKGYRSLPRRHLNLERIVPEICSHTRISIGEVVQKRLIASDIRMHAENLFSWHQESDLETKRAELQEIMNNL